MKTNTKTKIINNVKSTFAQKGYEAVSIRSIAKELGLSQSVIYHYFESKDKMLYNIFEEVKTDLGKKRKNLVKPNNTQEMLIQRINFQLDNATDVLYILKFYAHFRDSFSKNAQGYIPMTAYKHTKEILNFGVEKKEFANKEIVEQSKVIAHAINGFVLEYYPHIPTGQERNNLVNGISNFIYRGILKLDNRKGVQS